MDREKWTALPDSAKNAHVVQALAETAAPDTATPEVVRIGEINSNIEWPTEGQDASLRLSDDPASDVALEDIFGGSDSDS